MLNIVKRQLFLGHPIWSYVSIWKMCCKFPRGSAVFWDTILLRFLRWKEVETLMVWRLRLNLSFSSFRKMSVCLSVCLFISSIYRCNQTYAKLGLSISHVHGQWQQVHFSVCLKMMEQWQNRTENTINWKWENGEGWRERRRARKVKGNDKRAGKGKKKGERERWDEKIEKK